MNKEFYETEKVKWDVMKVKYEARKIRDNYYFSHLMNLGKLLALLSLTSC